MLTKEKGQVVSFAATQATVFANICLRRGWFAVAYWERMSTASFRTASMSRFSPWCHASRAGTWNCEGNTNSTSTGGRPGRRRAPDAGRSVVPIAAATPSPTSRVV